ncbi:MAG: MFS transporter [Opitutaceae bacterium]|nr:MFS transporter [Cytophagales bacterium]
MTQKPKEIQRKAVSALFMAFGFGFSTWASGIPELQQKLNISDATLGYLLFAIPLGDLITIPFSGWLTARFGTRNLVMYFVVFYAFILFLLSTVSSVLLLLILMAILGIASNLVSLCINTQSVLVQKLYQKSIIGTFHGTWSFAGFAGAAFGALISWWEIPVMWHFGIASVVIIFLAVFSNAHLAADEFSKKEKGVFTFPDSSLILLGAIALSCMVVEGTMFDWSGIYFKKVVMPPENLLGLGYTSFMGCMALGRFVSDKFVDRFGAKNTLILSSLLITSGLLLAVSFPFIIPVVCGFVIVGFGVAPVVPIVFGLAGKSDRFHPSIALNIVGSIGFIGFLCGPPMIGTLSGVLGLRYSFLVIACFGLFISVLGSKMVQKKT